MLLASIAIVYLVLGIYMKLYSSADHSLNFALGGCWRLIGDSVDRWIQFEFHCWGCFCLMVW